MNKLGRGATAKIMQFVVAKKATDDSRIPSRLTDFEPLTAQQATVTREFEFKRGGAERDGMSLWNVVVKFYGYGKYVFHCHNLEHEDMAMMDNFEVV
ncbi:multicopper oxidase domain-containing protein [Microlunatus elymi]|uniref:multicopper oxidase domain-containing protein n=1 Tax=Microlunatus elymi TaxID=2596828 RepID=UPI001D198967|nr:multicopper oxidase domain-containing protein [Microlunatus elymi]